MATELKLFRDAYATMTVAVYEPLVMRWYSLATLWHIADAVARRAYPKAKKLKTGGQILKVIPAREGRLPKELDVFLARYGLTEERLARYGSIPDALEDLSADKRADLLRSVPNFETVGRNLTLRGAIRFARNASGTVGPSSGLKVPSARERIEQADVAEFPIIMPSRGFDVDWEQVEEFRQSTLDDLKEIVRKGAGADKPIPARELRKQILDLAAAKVGQKGFDTGIDFFPVQGEWLEALSPIGIAHYYRQLYFNAGEGVGPIEEAFTIAPAETLEILMETVRRQTHEEIVEFGSEEISESAIESKNLDEVSDKVSSMVQRDSSAAMSSSATMSASGGIGVWSASASATVGGSTDLKTSSQRGTELASRRLKETTRKASERITKTFSIRTRDVLDVTTTNLTRRTIKNDDKVPVSYGLRRVYRRVAVKVQNLGSRMVWQLYLRNPGTGLARSKFVHFMESQPIADQSAPPATKPRPAGGTDTGTTSASLQWDNTRKTYFVTVVVRTGSDRRVTAVSIDSITDLEGGGKDNPEPSARNDVQWGKSYVPATNTFTVNVGILQGDAASVQVAYTYVYEPGPSVLAEWEAERAAAQAEFEKAQAAERQKALVEQFERDKALITERSKIRTRPPNDLRREERYEVMNRMVSHLFARQQSSSVPSPLEIELFHRYFEIEGMFIYLHPSWWRPRYSPTTTGLVRPSYEVTAESEPAPMGSSLGWLIQLDGDTRRNEFLNSPWVRVCLPIQPVREREAISWLAEHIEGEIGYDPGKDPLKSLLTDIETIRKNEQDLGKDGPDYVTVDSTVGAPDNALKPENVFPVVDEFEVTLPTEGFVYDALNVTTP